MASSGNVSQMRNPFLLGFYSQWQSSSYRENLGRRRTTIKCGTPILVSICKEGLDLKDGKWGNFDESLSFLPQPVQIVGSSNGCLLCCTDRTRNMNFIVCNPVTREFRIIPEPFRLYRYAAIAFICRGYGDTFAAMQYEIYRVGVDNCRTPTTTFEMETFSSTSGEWTGSSLVTPTPINLVVAFGSVSLVFENVIYWRAYNQPTHPEQPRTRSSQVAVAYHPATESVDTIRLPDSAQNRITCSDGLSHTQGKIHYARHDNLDIEVWLLQDIERGEWTLKHKVSVEEMLRENIPHVPRNGNIQIAHFHPQKQKILLKISSRWYWYNYQSGKLSGGASGGSVGVSFPYEWPCQPTYDS